MPPIVSIQAPDFVKNVLGKIIAGNGDELPVSAMPIDGTFPTATAQWEKRNIALGNSGLGNGDLYSVQQMRYGMSACSNSCKSL